MSIFGENNSPRLSIFLQTHIFWNFDHISRICNQINYRNIWFPKVKIILIMTAQVLFSIFFQTVNQLCTCILRVPSSCPRIAHIHSWTLWKIIILLQSLAQKWNTSNNNKKTKKKQKTHTHTSGKTTETGNIKLKYQIITSNIELFLNSLFFRM